MASLQKRDAIIMKLTRNLRRSFILLIGGAAVIILYACLVFFIENKIENKLAEIHGVTSAIRVNLLTRSLHIQNLELYPTERPYSIRLKTLTISGVHLYQLLVHNKILINDIQADSGNFSLDRALQKETDKASGFNFQGLLIQHLSLTNITGEIKTDTLVHASGTLNFQVSEAGIEIDFLNKPTYSIGAFNGTAAEININRSSGMYGISIKSFHFNSYEEKITIDSALLIPNFGKYEFAHQFGEQVARINLSVPQLIVEGIHLKEILDSTFVASKVEIVSFDLHSFKDKRVPFLRTHNIPLPMESFLNIPYPITVDSLVIRNSQISIEEIAETGTESGMVTFENVNATVAKLSNKNTAGGPASAILEASGLLMGTGDIKASFTLPLDGSPTYRASGSISKLPFEKLNPILENLVRFRIESGKLNNMKFDFQYTDLHSTGTLEIDYEDLRMTSLKKKNDETNEIKTLFINAFVRNDKTRSLSKLKRTGNIDIERDRRRYIFNIWLKSILDGLKSTVLESKQANNHKLKNSKQ
jgi:hypothetical protein